MAGDKFDQLYNALKADGAVSGTREHFRQFVYAPGKQGYHNRKQLYDALHADGAVSSKSYEEFAQRLGLHAVNPKPQQQKPLTMKQRAQKVAAQYQQTKLFEQPKYQQIKPLAQNKPQQPVDYLHRPHNQMGRARRNAPGKASPFVQSLYEIDNAQNGPDYSVDYTSPKATQQVYQNNQQVRRHAAKTASDHIVNDEYRRQSQPMIDNGTVGVMKPMGEIEQEMSDAADSLVASSGDFIKNSINNEYKQATLNAEKEIRSNDAMGNPFMGSSAGLISTQIANKYESPDKIMASLQNSIKENIANILPQAREQAIRLGVSEDYYINNLVLPKMVEKAVGDFRDTEVARRMPKNDLDYFIQEATSSNYLAKLGTMLLKTKSQRQFDEEALARTNEGMNPNYKPSTALRVGADVVGMISDPIFGASAKAGGLVAGKLIGNSTKIGTLMANGNLLQRLTLQGTQAVTSGGVTGFVFDSTGSVIQNYSTGEDTSLGNTLSVAAKGGATGAANFATMSLASVPLSQLGRSIGLKGVEGGSFWGNTGRATAKVVLETGKTYMEAMGMYLGGYVAGKIEGHTDANGNPVKFDLWNGTIESLPTAIGFRIQHAIGGLKGGRKNEKGEDMGWAASTLANFREFLTSDKAKVSKFMMSEEEKKQIMDSFDDTNASTLFHNVYGAAKNSKTRLKTTDSIFEKPYVPEPTKYEDVERDLEGVRTVYDKIMADPNVSWDAKAKFSAMVMGIMPSARPKMDFVGFSTGYVDNVQHKYVDEYSDKGELLSRRKYKNISEREAVIYKLKANAENVRLRNAVALVAGIDKNNYELQNAFFQMKVNRGANANDVIEGLKTPGSEIDKEFSEYAMNMGNVNRSLEFVADNFNKSVDWVLDAFEKDPMYRNDDQQKAAVLLRRSLENTAFPNGKVHEEQSKLNGKDIAEDNNLGTEQPNGDAVKQELNGLRQAEEEVEVLMRDNDVFSQNFKKLQSQGLTNPQIYDWMVQQGGLTIEQLEPFAHYINANARVQGMQEATKQKIEETVSAFVQDWSYHGTLNGQPMNGEQALYVQDSNGRTLLVGSGYVAFYQTTGRAKEGSGDMLVCLDLNTKEILYVKADEVTLFQNQPIDQFAAGYRQRLQIKNSEPYNQAAQEQAMQDAAENQDQSESGKGNDASETPEIVSEATPVETPTDFSFNNGKGRINSYKATPHEKTKSDGTKEITFSSEVTYTKGAPKGHKEGEVRNIGNGGGFIKIDPIDIDYQQYAVYDRLHDDGTAFSKDEATSEDIAEAKELIDTLLTPQLAEEMGPQYNVNKIIIAPDGRVFAKFIGMDGNIPLKRNPLEKAPQDDTTKSEDNTTKEGNLTKDDTNLTKDDTNLTKDDTNLTKDDTTNEDLVPQEQPKPSRKFADGSDVPMATDSKGRPTPDYGKMTPEQSAEILTEDFGENAEKVVDGQIQKAEKALKDAEKMKVDYTAEPNDIMEQEALKTKTVEAAKKQLDHAQNIKKAMTAKKVAETVGSTEQTEGAQEASGGNEPAEAGEGRVKSDLDRITETDEEFEVEGKYGTIYKKKYLIDGDKEVMKVDEPNKNGDYTGSYYEYNGKKYGDLRGVFEHLDDKPDTGSEEMPEGPIYDRKKALIDEINESDIKKKDDAFQILYKAEDLLDDYYGIPHDEWRQEPSRSNTITGILSMARNMLDRIENEPVEPASERQLAFLESLTKDDPTTREQLEGVELNKRQASWLIGRIKGLDDNLMSLHPDDIAEAEKEIHDGIKYMKKMNGETSDEGGLPLLPNEEKPDPKFNPIEAAAAEFKKEHPMTEEEIMKADVDDVVKDMALDYLNGEVTDDLHRAIYESIFVKTRDKVKTSESVPSVEQSVSSGETDSSIVRNENKPQNNEVKGSEKEETNVKNDVKTADDAAVVASNKKVNDLWKELMNAGKDELSASFVGLNSKQLELLPKLVGAMAENAYLRIKRGMHNLEDVVKEMRKEFAPAAKVFKKEDVDAIYEQMMNIRYRDGEQRMSLKEWADYYEKTSPKHQENLVGDSKSAEERKQKENSFINRIQTVLSMGEFKTGIAGMRKIAENCGLEGVKDTDLQELVETAIVGMARRYATSKAMSDDVKFAKIKLLYNRQPSLNQRDSERVMKGQFSTPAPYAYLADMYVKGNGKVIESALEPSAGNGMLTIGLPMDKVHVNDIDAQRLANLRRQGFKNVTSQDGTQPFADKDVDVVVTNPPFGSATPKEYDGYKISSLEGQMAINALESMKDDGRAAIIIGGKTEYAKNGSLNPKDKAFLGYLYSHYNVEDVINVDGSLYAKQGTSYPTRIILINGRRLNENAFPPVKDKARAETVKDYDELYKRIKDDILRGERMDSSIGEEGGKVNAEPDKQGAADTPKERVRARERGGSEPDGKRGSDVSDTSSVSGTHDDLDNQRGTEPRKDGELPDGDSRTDGTGAEPTPSKEPTAGANDGRVSGSEGAGGNDTQPSSDEPASTWSGSGPRGQLQRVDKSVRGLSTEKVAYAPKSGNPFTLKAVMPADQQEAVNKNLEKLGDADQFLVDELGYNDKDDLYSHLAAEQVDSVALALQQAKKGNAFIIGDMTGIGKGRQAASLIRYAKKQGQVPVYFTKTAGLLSDVYRDLVDIGSPDLRPFVFGSAKEAAITDSEGNVVFALPSKSEVKRVLDYIEKNGKLPDEYDYVLTTYSQVSNGVYEFDEDGNRKERKLAKGKSFGAAALSGQKRRDAIEKLMGNAYLILDESHTAGGNSGQGNYFQHIIQKAKNVTFFSATFAKRPDNMPIYALRTAMNEGGMKASDLIDAVKRGGATLQEIMSQTLTQCGQMIRRERDMTGVTIDWKAIDDPERVQEQREQYDSIIGLFNDIINFQKKYVSGYVDKRNEELAEIQSTIGIKKGTAALGIKNQPFASKAFNTVQQVLLSLKAKSAAERAIDYLKQGMKPVIALNNTNESQTGNLALGEEMDAPDLGTSLKKGLEGTLRYTQKDAKDNSESGYFNLEDLGEEAVEAYHELEKKIEQTSTGLSLSPIDVIKNELQKAGYKVGELTGRQTEFVYNENGTVTKVKRADTDKKKLAREFNDGQIDALILNKSAATGISLHASSKYKDQRKRVMIVAQQQLDVNDEVQMRGRIDRTGQVLRGSYEYVVSLIPAEQRLLMMFKAKLKSLDANTTSSQKSKFNEMDVADITNKYGDKVVREYMAEHLDLYSRMADPFGWENRYGDDLSRIDPQSLVASGGSVGDGEAGADASKLLGRMALLKVAEQEKMLQEIGELYANEIQRLNEMGENDLEITELPLKAKTLHKEVWKQGAEPGGDNAFADNTYIEKVNMAILKKPMKAAEVKASQEGLTGGKTWEEYKTEKKAAVKEYFDKKIADETQKYEERAVKAATKAKEKYIKDGKKGQDKSGMTDEQIAKNAGFQYDTIYNQEKDKLNDVIKNLNAKAEMFNRVLDTFDTNGAFVLPMDMNNPNELSGFGNSYGRLIDIKITDNYSPNASSVSFATLDGRRKITFPIAGKVGSGENKVDIIGSIDRMTKQASGMGDSHLRVLNQNFDNWDRLTSNESRKNGYIVTGNLMQALVDSKDQGLGGQLVKYTTDTGEVKTGILMPDRFDPKGLTTDAPINSVAEKFELSSWHGGIDEVTSSDGEVKVKRIDNYRGNYYEIRVPNSKAKGGKYFTDKELLEMVDGHNFETRGNSMLAEFKPEKLKPVLDRLSKMGVKVQEERKTSENISDAPNVTSVVATGTNNRGLEKKPLLDVKPVGLREWMREHPGKYPTSNDLFGQPHVDAQLGKELGRRVLGVTDAGVKMTRIDYEGGYKIQADGYDGDYINQTYYPDGQVMTRANFDIGMSGSQLEKYIKYDKNRIPYSNINDVVTNFMENIGKSSNSDNGTHFREDRGLQYSKTDTKDVKNSRIIPEDVDKDVSSQIEKSYDVEVNRLFGHYLSPNQKRFVDETANDYASRSLHDEYYVDEETKEKKTVRGLDSAYKFWNDKVTEFEQKYGINRNTDISRLEEESRKAFANSFGEGRNSGRSAEQTNRYQGKDGYSMGGTGSGRDKASLPTPEEIFGYQCDVLERESVLRAYRYHKERARILSEKYGIDSGGWIQPETIEKIFNDFNTDKNLKVLFDRIKDQVNDLGIYFGEVYGEEKGTDGFYRHDSFNDIRLNIDGLLTAARTRQDFASVILHEMLHPLTSDIIAMYQKGHADKLTKSQAEAAKNVVDIYNRLKSLYKEKGWKEPYALTNPREMMTELANPSWREALQGFEEGRSIWRKVLDSIRKFFGFAPTRPGLSDLNKALDNVLNNFGKEQFDFATRHYRELFGKEPQGHKVTDPEEIKRLEEEPKINVYRAMQVIDGKLYPPMAAYADGKLVEANELGKWIKADEMPDSKNTVYKYKGTTTTIPKDRAVKGEDGIWRDSKNGAELAVGEDGNPTWYFKLQKGKGATGKKLTDVPAAYNPYWHTSYSPLNDQFKSAWIRPNVVVVECEVPAGELTSGYRAEHAKDPVGMTPWTSGVVTKQLVAKGHEGRKVMLSRWCKPVRIVPDEEVAAKIKDFIGDYDVEIPENVVTPRQKVELEKLGVKIGAPEKGMNKNEQIAEAIKLGLQVDNTVLSEDGTKFRTNHGDGNYPASSVEIHVEKVAQKTGAKVNIVSSVDEINNKAAKAAIEEGRKITGWYDEKTGEVHLYMPNIHDRYTAEKTIWHEVVGHKGMRELFGEDRFEKFLRDVWYDLDKPENSALKKLVDEERKYNPLNIYDAIEEGIARLAEDGKGEAGFWNGIKNKVSDFLHEIGYRIAPNTKDVKYLLWLSKNLQKNQNDPYWKMRAEAVKYRLDHDRVPAVVAHDGMFYGNDGKVKGMDNLTKSEWNEATDGEIHLRTTPSAGTALDRYHRSLNEHGYMFTESYMDNMLSLKKLMNAIVPDKKIEDIASSENPYMLQNTMQGAMSDAAQMFERNVMKPLDKAMAGVLDAFDGKKDDEKIRNFNLYMITKHGLERNRVFFVRDFLKKIRRDEKKKQDADMLEQSWYNDKEYLDNELRAGNIDLKEYYRQMDENIRNYFDADFEAGEHDYSGIHAIQEVEKSSDPYDDAEAIQSVMDSEAKMEGIRKGAVKDYWDKVKAATQYSINSDYKNGIISSELYGHVSNMFNWYVPLRKYDEATAEDVYGYITEVGDPKSYIGSTIMRARGHKYLSETNVLAQIGAMGNRAIKNGGMNAIRQAFARFARNNSNNNLITETSVWYEKDPMTGIVYERYPDIPDDATADEINQIVSDFNKDMKAKALQNLASKVYRRGSIGYKFQRAENKSQHIVDVKIAGRTHAFIINGNPRAAQALNGLLENSGAKGIMKPLSSISRMMAQLCTSYNPEFVMRNIMRDAEFASSNVTSKEGARYGALWAKYYAQLGLYKGASNISLKDFSGSTGLGLFAKYRNGTLDMSNKVERYFKEFMENGGETGWVQIKNMKDWTKGYKKDVSTERSKLGKGGAALRDFFFGNLENVNEVAENIARFATYCTSRDSNRSIIRSVYDAKEVSTNFNRHGSGDAISSFKNGEMTGGKAAERWVYGFTASYLRHCSMFFNAGIQSTNLLVKNLKNHPVGTSINMLAIPFALGALAALGNNVLIASEDEKDRKGVKDPYGELPDYVRRNNLCIYKGNGEFVTIPLAIELRAFYGLGDLAAGLTFSPNVSGQKNPYFDAMGCMSQLVPVMDYLGNSSAGKEPLNETIKAITPSALSPFVEWEMNTDWKGAPIERRGDWNEDVPAWQRAYKGTPDGYMSLNKFVNAQTNEVAKGNEDMLGNSFLDMVTNPSMLNHYIGGLGGGAATFIERAIGVVKHGKDTETKDIPFLRSLLYTPSEQSSLQRTKSKWYNYKDEMEKMIANVDRLKSKNVPIEKRISNYSDYYRFQNSKDAAKVRVIELAEKQMKQWKKLRDKSSDTESINFANQNIDRIMMEAVDDLDKLN